MKQPKLKIGDKVICRLEQRTGIIIEILNDAYLVEFGDFRRLLPPKELQLIKPKTKKVKKWENSRKELADWISELDINYKNLIIANLLATQPQPIKEERIIGITQYKNRKPKIVYETNHKQEEPNTNSKEIDDDIDLIEIETDLSTKKKYVDGLEITQLDEFLINKINLMIFFINSLTNRK